MDMFRTKWPPRRKRRRYPTPFTQWDNVSLCLGRIIGSNSVDFRVGCFFMTPYGCRVTRTSRAVMCVSTETRKNVTNHRGQSQNKQSGFERTCPTCAVTVGALCPTPFTLHMYTNWTVRDALLSIIRGAHAHPHKMVCKNHNNLQLTT